MSASNALENSLLDHIFGNTAYAAPSTVYVALHTADPGDSGDQSTNEASGTSYARVAVTNNTTNFPNASGGLKSNGADIVFPTVGSGGWGTVTHWSIGTEASGAGSLLVSGALASSKVTGEGDVLTIATGDLSISVD